MKKLRGNILDLENRCFYPAEICFDEKIVAINPIEGVYDTFILPGLIDSHVHIESSMLTPVEFSRLVVSRGTVAVVSDPHEIANVMGLEGIDFMVENSHYAPLKIFFGAPSCVPATNKEVSGAVLNTAVIEELLKSPDIWFLSEMMNYPGVINSFSDALNKISAAKGVSKPVDGHAPGLMGEELKKYIDAGVSTDHECSTLEEALLKISLGMKIQIREGSAARNFDSLYSLIASHPDSVMLCTDDSHPDEIIEKGHIDKIIALGLKKGLSIFDLLRAVYNPVAHYNIPVGLLKVGDPADFIVVDDIDRFNVVQTYIDGELVFNQGVVDIPEVKPVLVNHFNRSPISLESISVSMPDDKSKARVIVVQDGVLETSEMLWSPLLSNSKVFSSVKDDVLKIVVLNRYDSSAVPSVGFISGFGLKTGAIGSSIAHDSHHIVVVGVSDEDIVECINTIIHHKGAIVVVDDKKVKTTLPLPIAGIMSDRSGVFVADTYKELNLRASSLGCQLKAPFMTLSFMSLLVIPSLKLGDKGLFDVNRFDFVDLFVS